MHTPKLAERLLLAFALALCAAVPLALSGCGGTSKHDDMSVRADASVLPDLSLPQPDLSNADLGDQD